ncbi:FAD-NAD(P)-binding-domain-containing protein [Hypoxylon fuscum]|nr:FAD-NAD(P)-binding-domain-containing protein [Hypoxylon fuscum]
METDTPTQQPRNADEDEACPTCLQKREITDVLIIGAGAAGVAVALSVLEKVREGWPIESLTMVEKGDEAGRGLAYSSTMRDTMSNRRNDAMSLIHNDPNHFSNWKRDNLGGTGGEYSEREVYGDYLQDMLRKVNITAWDLLVDFRFIRREVMDLDHFQDKDATVYRVTLEDGCSVYAKKVVLALGNFLAVKEPQLLNARGYFSNPWPLKKLEGIPEHAALGIIGTNSSAIEVVTKLYDKHKGPVYMMSRNGRLPSSERTPRSFPQHYALHAITRGLEKGEISLKKTLDSIENIICDDTSNDDIGVSHVLDALKPIAERIWNAATQKERTKILPAHLAWKIICQETMPNTPHALHSLHFKGGQNVKILQDEGVGLKGDYHFLMGRRNRARVDYVIEATGLEHDADVIASESPLLRQILRKNIVKPDPFGGIKASFADNKAGPALYDIGSLTKGTHYFVEDIAQVALRASRISDSLIGLPPSQPLQVALFVGRDLFSTIIMTNVVRELLAKGHMPLVFLLTPPDESIYSPADERAYWFFESLLLPQVVIPDYKLHGGPPQLALTMSCVEVENQYGVLVQEVKNINDPGFVSGLYHHDIDIGFLIGSKTKAKERIRKSQNLYELRPGLPPSYQSTREVMRAGGERFGYTIEYLGRGSEDEIFPPLSRDRSIAGAPCACTAMIDSYKLAVELVIRTVDKYSRDRPVGAWTRNPSVSSGKTDHIEFANVPVVLDRILDHFATPETRDHLLHTIQEEMKYWGVASDQQENKGSTQEFGAREDSQDTSRDNALGLYV